MPRRSRIHAAKALRYVIVRGIERKKDMLIGSIKSIDGMASFFKITINRFYSRKIFI